MSKLCGYKRIQNMLDLIKSYLAENDGATAIEYGLIVAAIGLAIVATVGIIGVDLGATFTDISTYL